jgi:hypothetical protein
MDLYRKIIHICTCENESWITYNKKIHFRYFHDFFQHFLPTHEKYTCTCFFFDSFILYWKKHIFTSILLQGISVLYSIMYDIPLIFPWSSQHKMTNIHRYNIAQKFIIITSYFKFNFTLSTYHYLMSFLQPRYLVRIRMRICLQLHFFHHLCGY